MTQLLKMTVLLGVVSSVWIVLSCNEQDKPLTDCENRFIGEWMVHEKVIFTLKDTLYDTDYNELQLSFIPGLTGRIKRGTTSDELFRWECQLDTLNFALILKNNTYYEDFSIDSSKLDTIYMKSHQDIVRSYVDSNIISILQLHEERQWKIFR